MCNFIYPKKKVYTDLLEGKKIMCGIFQVNMCGANDYVWHIIQTTYFTFFLKNNNFF